ncbi:MAG: efflux RND transporter periplasmic adaptor subunit [Nitrospira sp.]|nr:efflux RND transporter periplasmic adaptor subunit [Nitrospira sp.]MDH5337839.1 efflux RND transporter periplasmic adaptor subunit [Nitrospira sp.]
MREAHSRRTSESEIKEWTKGMGFVAHTCLNQHTTGLRTQVIRGLAACMIMALGVACENKPAETSTVKPDLPSARTGLLRLTPEELSRMQLELVPVAQGQLLSHREFSATVQANQNELAEVTTLIRGRVVKVHVDVGQDVKKGALLAMLHSVDLGVAEGDYLKAGARLHEAELAHLRAKDLYENKAVSLAELQRREAAMKTARAELREAKNRLELLGVPLEEIGRLERELTIKANMPLRAPFDGRVITRNITRGEVVETEQKLFTVANLTDVWVIGNVPEKDVRFIRKDQKVNVVLAAYPHAIFSGAITYVGDVLDPATRTMRLRVRVPNPDRLLKPEMFAIVSVFATSSPEALSVPLASVQDGSGGKMVFVQREDGAFEARTVKLGDEEGDVVRVLEGVKAGEQVVTKGSFALKSEMERHKIEPSL